MKYLVSAESLAHYVVDRCNSAGHPVSNLQLQKILYFLQLVYCRTQGGRALLFPEPFQAWPYGPVLPDIYHEYSEYGGRAIEKSYANGISFGSNDGVVAFINEGVDLLSKKSPWDLVRISHAQGSPWHQVYRDGVGYKAEIDNALIVEAARAGAA